MFSIARSFLATPTELTDLRALALNCGTVKRLLILVATAVLAMAAHGQSTVDVQFQTDGVRDMWWSRGWPYQGPVNPETLRGSDVLAPIPTWTAKTPLSYLCIADEGTGNMFIMSADGIGGTIVVTPHDFDCVSEVHLVLTNRASAPSGTLVFSSAEHKALYKVTVPASFQVTLYAVPSGTVRVAYTASDGSTSETSFNVPHDHDGLIPTISVDLAGGPKNVLLFVGVGIVVGVAVAVFVSRGRSSHRRRRR